MTKLSAKLPSFFKLSAVSGLQIFQLIRYGGFTLVGILFAKLHIPQSGIAQYEFIIMTAGLMSFFFLGGVVNTMLSLYPEQDNTKASSLFFNSFLILSIYPLVVLAGVFLLLEVNPSLLGNAVILVAFYNIIT